MKKITNIFLPIFDHLYIFQLFEYDSKDFFLWFLKFPWKRSLQKKHKLVWTQKAVLLFSLTILLMVYLAIFASYFMFDEFLYWVFIVIFFYLGLFSPMFLIFSQLLLLPLDYYQKKQIIKKAKAKIKLLNNLTVVAIVGSFAKTTTKNMLYTLLWKDFRVIKTPKSYNTQVSVARTILSDLKQNTEVFICEMDAYHKGEIKNLAHLVKPDLGIITAVGKQHLSRFGSMETLAHTQFELAETLKTGSKLFLNDRDEWSKKIEGEYKVNKIFFGSTKECDFYLTDIVQKDGGISFKLSKPSLKDKPANIFLPLQGEHNAYNFLAAASIANTLGLSLEKIAERAKLILPTDHRLEIKQTGNITIIDNTYNTNPTASIAALKLLKDIKGQQKIVITPGLIELGNDHIKENVILGEEIAKVADKVIIVGENAKNPLKKGLKNFKGELIYADSTQKALEILQNINQPNTIALLENDLPDQYF